MAGVKLATASEPPARKPRIWGRGPSGVDPSHPLWCNLLLNLAELSTHSGVLNVGTEKSEEKTREVRPPLAGLMVPDKIFMARGSPSWLLSA